MSLPNSDVDALLKKSEAQHEQPEDGCPFGALTQRLLQALVEVSTPSAKQKPLSLCFNVCLLKYIIYLERYIGHKCTA